MKIATRGQFSVLSGKEAEFAQLVNAEVVPLLKKQKGFEEGFMLVNRDGAMGISVWKDKPSADAFQTSVFPQLAGKLAPVLKTNPTVSMFEVVAAAQPG
jgi:hypothetical protein